MMNDEDLTAGGQKFDQDKIPMDLLDPEFLEGISRVLQFGAKKYSAHNWRQGISYSRLYAAAQRHLNAFAKGWTQDDETGESHLLHAACCLMFLYHMQQYRPELNDMFWADKVETEPKTRGLPDAERLAALIALMVAS